MKIYGEQKSVDHLNITVNQVEIYGFLCRNGAGKTTTILILLMLIKHTCRQVEIFCQNLFNNQIIVLRRIGYNVEVPGLYEYITVRENLLINALILGVHKKNTIEEALDIVDRHYET